MEGRYINIHTHQPGEGISIADPCLGHIVLPDAGTVYFSMGIHPCLIGEDSPSRLAAMEEAAREDRIVAVGEAGLDRTSATPMSIQMEYLEKEVDMASRYGLPLIIHGVRAVPELISLYNRQKAVVPWIMHGFNNRKEVLYDLLRHGFYISAGRHVMEENSHIARLLPEIPLERLFMETDNSDFGIGDIYRKVAAIRGMTLEGLVQAVAGNFNSIFHIEHGREY